ncbi:MAG: hypothetical protein R3B84_11615 [Zavarzinella sp.]
MMNLLRFTVLLIMMGMGVGCESKRPGELQVYSVKGQATFNGEPMAYLVLTFYPADQPVRSARVSRAYADADGRFEVTTYELNDGMPLGDYNVILWWPEGKRNPSDLETGDEPDRLKRAYNDPEKSTIQFTVKPETNTFQLKLP